MLEIFLLLKLEMMVKEDPIELEKKKDFEKN